MKGEAVICLSSLLTERYPADAANLTAVLETHGVPYRYLKGTRDIWLRDFMPVRTGSGHLVSFGYEPSYLADVPELRTDFRKDIAPGLGLPVRYSGINLDGGNVVYSPSGQMAVVSDRILRENPNRDRDTLLRELEVLLEADVILIPSLDSDMTGHADGMVRFVDERTAIGNRVPAKHGLEQRIRAVLNQHGIEVVNFPYFSSPGDSAVGCYLNFLEAGGYIFLPVFGTAMDGEAIAQAKALFDRPVVPVLLREVARQGGCLNCITWEWPEPGGL